MSRLQLVLVAVALWSCAEARQPSRTVRDSSGVEIVTLGVPDTIQHQWRVAVDSASLLIGGRGDTSGVFGRFDAESSLRLGDGRIVTTADEGNHILVFDQSGRLLARLGRDGDGPGEYRHSPTLIAYADSVVAVDEGGGQARVTVLGPDLKFARDYRIRFGDTRGSSPEPIGITSRGRVVFRHEYVTRNLSGLNRAPAEMLVADASGGETTPIVQFAGEERLEVTGGMNTYIVFGKTAAMAVAGNHLYAGANDGFTLQSYDATGRLHRELRIRLPATPVTASMRQGWIADQYVDTTAETGRIARLIVPTAVFAHELRAYEGFYPTREGGLWIERARLRDKDAHRFWVFDSAGRSLAATSLPASMKPVAIWGDSVLVRGRDADDVLFLAIYHIMKSSGN